MHPPLEKTPSELMEFLMASYSTTLFLLILTRKTLLLFRRTPIQFCPTCLDMKSFHQGIFFVLGFYILYNEECFFIVKSRALNIVPNNYLNMSDKTFDPVIVHLCYQLTFSCVLYDLQ